MSAAREGGELPFQSMGVQPHEVPFYTVFKESRSMTISPYLISLQLAYCLFLAHSLEAACRQPSAIRNIT